MKCELHLQLKKKNLNEVTTSKTGNSLLSQNNKKNMVDYLTSP